MMSERLIGTATIQEQAGAAARSAGSSRLARAVGLARLNKHARHVTALRTLVGDQAGLAPARSYGHDIFHCGTASHASRTGAVLSVRHEL
jgi:hypothetical protein